MLFGVKKCCCNVNATIASFNISSGARRFVLDHGAGFSAGSRAMLPEGTSLWDCGSSVTGEDLGVLAKWTNIDSTPPSTPTYSDRNGGTEQAYQSQYGDLPFRFNKSSDGTYYGVGTTRVMRWNSSLVLQNNAILSGAVGVFESTNTATDIDTLENSNHWKVWDAALSSSTGGGAYPGVSSPNITRVSPLPGGGYVTWAEANSIQYSLVQWNADLTVAGYAEIPAGTLSSLNSMMTVTGSGNNVWSYSLDSSPNYRLMRHTLGLGTPSASAATDIDIGSSSDLSGIGSITPVDSSEDVYRLFLDGSLKISRHTTSGTTSWTTTLGTGSLINGTIRTCPQGVVFGGQYTSSGTNYHCALLNSSGTLQWQNSVNTSSTIGCSDITFDDDGHPYISFPRVTA